jgi:hypothetical protein
MITKTDTAHRVLDKITRITAARRAVIKGYHAP